MGAGQTGQSAETGDLGTACEPSCTHMRDQTKQSIHSRSLTSTLTSCALTQKAIHASKGSARFMRFACSIPSKMLRSDCSCFLRVSLVSRTSAERTRERAMKEGE